MIMNDFDDERTMEEEEALEAEDEADELSALEQEQVGLTSALKFGQDEANIFVNINYLQR